MVSNTESPSVFPSTSKCATTLVPHGNVNVQWPTLGQLTLVLCIATDPIPPLPPTVAWLRLALKTVVLAAGVTVTFNSVKAAKSEWTPGPVLFTKSITPIV